MRSLLLVTAALVLCACSAEKGEQARPGYGSSQGAPVTVATVVERDFALEIAALGTLRAWESVDISASVSQIITDIAFEDGDKVHKGQVLARLKQDAEQASLREQQAELADARREVERLANLARQNQVAQTDLDKARTLEAITRHRIEVIEAGIADRTIVAPFSGSLGLRQVSEGALVSPGQRLTTLDDLSRMRLDFSVPATQLALLAVGQPMAATAPAFNEVFEGRVAAIDSRIDPVARAVRVRAVLDNPDAKLRAGLLMEVRLTGPPHRALVVPEESLESRASNHYVWRVLGDRAERVKVEIEGRKPGWVAVSSGLSEGDQVVRDGIGSLRGTEAAVTVQEP